jgi:hypothetical protein
MISKKESTGEYKRLIKGAGSNANLIQPLSITIILLIYA